MTSPRWVSTRNLVSKTSLPWRTRRNKDLWINVPAMANDDYIQNLAELIYQDLNPNLKVYVEYSNETWNDSFQQYNQVRTAAAHNPVTTVKTGIFAVAQQSAFQTRYIGDVFKSVFGTESSRVLPVMGSFQALVSHTTRKNSRSCSRPTAPSVTRSPRSPSPRT